MRIALCSDEPYPVHATVRALAESRGHSVLAFGSPLHGGTEPWASVAEQAAHAIALGECDEGIFFCWSGTGISMAANKLPGVRAALCFDPQTASAARIWNHANVLCLSNRQLSDDVAKEILEAWFAPYDGDLGREGVTRLRAVDEHWRCAAPAGQSAPKAQ
jgi:ribose 5-phosphate isomerase B